MKPLPVFFTALAEEDLDQIEDYISASDPAAAARVRATIVKQSLGPGNVPAKGLVLRKPANQQVVGVRLWPVSQYRNYLILCKIEPKLIRVLRVLHAAQDWTRFFGKE
jgi:plasmid stabilization system protein ParE